MQSLIEFCLRRYMDDATESPKVSVGEGEITVRIPKSIPNAENIAEIAVNLCEPGALARLRSVLGPALAEDRG